MGLKVFTSEQNGRVNENECIYKQNKMYENIYCKTHSIYIQKYNILFYHENILLPIIFYELKLV